MKYHVFNKKPSQADVEAATKCSDPQEQQVTLALATFPAKGELWQNINTGRVLVIRSQHIPIQGTPTGVDGNVIDCYGVVVADVIGSELEVDFDTFFTLRQLEVDFDIFFSLRQLLNYKKIGRLKIKLGAV